LVAVGVYIFVVPGFVAFGCGLTFPRLRCRLLLRFAFARLVVRYGLPVVTFRFVFVYVCVSFGCRVTVCQFGLRVGGRRCYVGRSLRLLGCSIGRSQTLVWFTPRCSGSLDVTQFVGLGSLRLGLLFGYLVGCRWTCRSNVATVGWCRYWLVYAHAVYTHTRCRFTHAPRCTHTTTHAHRAHAHAHGYVTLHGCFYTRLVVLPFTHILGPHTFAHGTLLFYVVHTHTLGGCWFGCCRWFGWLRFGLFGCGWLFGYVPVATFGCRYPVTTVVGSRVCRLTLRWTCRRTVSFVHVHVHTLIHGLVVVGFSRGSRHLRFYFARWLRLDTVYVYVYVGRFYGWLLVRPTIGVFVGWLVYVWTPPPRFAGYHGCRFGGLTTHTTTLWFAVWTVYVGRLPLVVVYVWWLRGWLHYVLRLFATVLQLVRYTVCC